MKRQRLSDAAFRILIARQMGVCAGEGCTSEGPFDADHVQPLCLGGDNAEGNWQALCKACHRKKSSEEVTRKSKADRQGGRKGQYARRKENGPQMQSRGFSAWRGLDGSLRLKSTRGLK